ncbi:MAG: glycosyltransferase [Chloroflexi bacterium]|nr:glycosyltransferase [Chloroflexota bacterium]
MRVLMLTPGLPQPTGSGAVIRTWYILRHLVEQMGADVQVVTFGSDDGAPVAEPLPERVTASVLPAPVRDWRRRLAVLGGSTRPDLADRLWTPDAQTRVQLATQRGGVDLIYVGGLEVARYALEVRRQRGSAGPAIVLDEFNAEWLLQQRAAATDWRAPRRWPVAAYSAIQWRRLKRFERAACLAADGLVAVSAADAVALAVLDPALAPALVPNGVDVRRYAPVDPDTPGLPRFDLLFSGTMDYRPNIDAVAWLTRAVWPRLRQQWPALTLGLVGQRPTAAVRAHGLRAGITVTGAVPDDRPYLWGATAYVVPMRYGGGVRLKLLNALAAGRPVVSTTMGAEGIAVEHGRDVLLADTPAQWQRQLERVLGEPALRAHLGQAGQATAVRYDWSVLVRRFGAVYERALARRDGRPLAPAGTL